MSFSCRSRRVGGIGGFRGGRGGGRGGGMFGRERGRGGYGGENPDLITRGVQRTALAYGRERDSGGMRGADLLSKAMPLPVPTSSRKKAAALRPVTSAKIPSNKLAEK